MNVSTVSSASSHISSSNSSRQACFLLSLRSKSLLRMKYKQMHKPQLGGKAAATMSGKCHHIHPSLSSIKGKEQSMA